MTKKKLIQDNILLLIGGNLGNVFSFLFNMVLLRADAELANLYVAYNSVVLILGVPALVAMRILTVYGDSAIGKIRAFYESRPLLSNIIFILCILSLLPLNFIVQRITQDSNFITSFMLITLTIALTISYAFRGLKQYEEDFMSTVIALNIETAGRLIIGYVLGVVFGLGVNGVLIGAIVAMVLSIIPVFSKKYLIGKTHFVPTYKLKIAFFSTLILTAGIEFFSNFDIAYTFKALQYDSIAQTEYNVLQIFRKIIFYGIFIASAVILAAGSKKNHTKKFIFFYTLGSGLTIGIISAIISFEFKDIILFLLNRNLTILDSSTILNFLIFTALMSTAYLLSNWLLAQKRFIYTLIPIVSSIIQFIIYFFAEKTLEGLLNAYLESTAIFFALTTITGIYEIFFRKHND